MSYAQLELKSSLFILSNSRNIQVFTYSQDLPPGAGAAISFFRAGATGVGIDSNEYDQDLTLSEERIITNQMEPLHIEKIYHAQCLEKYPNHFAAFVKLSATSECSNDGKKILC